MKWVLLCGLLLWGTQQAIAFFQQPGHTREQLVQTPALTRYEMARVLEGMRCHDCLYPSAETIELYTADRLTLQKQEIGNYIDDITLTTATAQNKDYFYCVAGVVDAWVMQGYPLQTSLFCPGKFCGATLARYDELVESLYRLVRPQVLQNYTANRQEISKRVSASGIQLSIPELTVLKQAKERCGDTPCTLEQPLELDVYIRFCAGQGDRCGLPVYSQFGSLIYKQLRLAILTQAGIIPKADAGLYQPNSIVPGGVVAQYLAPLQQLVQCEVDADYDTDEVTNERDSCLHAYNPNQRDSDADGIGDVCDDDIDGDGITNTIGVVDDQGNLLPERVKTSKDNCIFVQNPKQTNGDKDGFWDRCDPDNPDIQAALMIQADPRIGVVPTEVVFTSAALGKIEQLDWTFGDDFFANGAWPVHTYTDVGRFSVVAKATPAFWRPVVSRLPISIEPPASWSVGCAVVVNPLRSTVPATISLEHLYTWALQQLTWQDDSGLLGTVAPGKTFEQLITQPWRYRFELQCYDQDAQWAGLSQAMIEVVEDDDLPSVAAYLKASTLAPKLWQAVQLSTVKRGFNETDLEGVVWEFGDGPAVTTPTLSIDKTFVDAGTYLVSQTILFKDQRPPLYQSLTLTVIGEQAPQTTALSGAPLSQNREQPFFFELTPINISQEQIRYLVWECGDERRDAFDGSFANHFIHTCLFAEAWSQRVRTTLYTKDEKIFINEMTVYVIAGDICPDDAPTITCDLDQDTFADRCDSDIDGDSFEQWMWLVIKEIVECPFDERTVDLKRLEEYHRYVRKTGSWDNCPFVHNPEQVDNDQDGYGSGCDSDDANPKQPDDKGDGDDDWGDGDWDGDGDGGDAGDKDSDGDWLPDKEDGCPGIPEHKDGKEDDDGCPELPSRDPKKNEKNPFIKAGKCTQCPCPFADYASALWKGDRVRALLLDPAGNIIYQYSQAEMIKADIGKLLEGESK